MNGSPAGHHVRIALGLCAAVLIAATLTACAEKHVSSGIYHLRQGDHESAIEAFREALEHDPDAAIAHYNLGYALSAKVRDEAVAGRYDGIRMELREANQHFVDAAALDPETYADDVATARRFNFTELYNLAVDASTAGTFDPAARALALAFEATDDPIETKRALVLGLQIDLSRALDSSASYSQRQAMRLIARLERLRTEPPVDAVVAAEIEALLERVQSILYPTPTSR